MFKVKLCRLVCLLILLNFNYGYSFNTSSIVIGCCKEKVTIWRYWEGVDGTLKEMMLIFNGDSSSVNISVSVSKLAARSQASVLEDVSSFGIIGGPWDIPPYGSMIADSLNFSVSDSSRFYLKITGIKKDSTIVLGYISTYNYKPLVPQINSALYFTPPAGRGRGDISWWELESAFIKSGSSSVIKLIIVESAATNLLYGYPFEGIMLMDDSLLAPGGYEYLMPHKIEASGFYEHYNYAKDSLDYWSKGIKYILNYSLPPFEKNSDNEERIFTINYHITAPPVNKPVVEYLGVIVKRGKVKTHYWLPVIINP